MLIIYLTKMIFLFAYKYKTISVVSLKNWKKCCEQGKYIWCFYQFKQN